MVYSFLLWALLNTKQSAQSCIIYHTSTRLLMKTLKLLGLRYYSNVNRHSDLLISKSTLTLHCRSATAGNAHLDFLNRRTSSMILICFTNRYILVNVPSIYRPASMIDYFISGVRCTVSEFQFNSIQFAYFQQ